MATLPTASDPTAAAASATADTYTNFSGLQALKRAAAKNDPAAIRKVAQQFESMFTRMMLKSMRDTVGTDPLFGSDAEKAYQGMYDDQLSIQMSKGRGLGLADMLVRQLQRLGAAGAAAAAGSSDIKGGSTTVPVSGTGAAAPAAKPALPAASAATQQNFIQKLLPEAQQAGQQLGVDPTNLLAQAALETNWGRNLPHDSSGHSSNNLFGVKATGAWNGASVQSVTSEVAADGSTTSSVAPFRSYADASQSFQDYVSLLRNNPRYAAALNTGSNAQAFAAGLQRGGYATDPDYARKVSAVANNISGHLAMNLRGLTALKFGADQPTTVTTSTL
jgi:peptidoglycan hydrolase FlgJ